MPVGGGAAQQQLLIDVRPGAASTVVVLRGELDFETASEVAAALDMVLEQGERHVVVDLRELAFLDVAGLHVLEGAAGRLSAHGGRMVVKDPSGPVCRLFELRRSWAGSDPWEVERTPTSRPRARRRGPSGYDWRVPG